VSNGGEVSVRFSSEGEQKVEGTIDRVDASLRKFAGRELKLQSTDLDKLVAKLGRLDEAFKKDLLTQQQHAAAVAKAHESYRGSWDSKAPKTIAPTAAVGPQISDDLKKFADRIKAIQVTPLERVTAETKKLDAALKAGLLTQQQYGAAAKKAQDDYQAELDQSIDKTKRVGQASGDTAKHSGMNWTGMLSTVGISTAAAMALVAKVFAGVREDADKSAQAVRASFRDVGQLGQIGGAAATKERLKIADEYFASGAVSTLGEARQTVLALSNVGAVGEAKLFSQLQRTGLSLNPADFADKAKRLQSTLGESEAGTFPQMMARAFVAAEPVNVQPGDLVAAASRSGQAASTLGVKSPELYAATASMIRAKGLEQGGERLASFLDKLTTLEGVEGTGISDRVASIQAKGLSPADLKKFLGDASAVEAVGILGRDSADLATRTRSIQGARPELLTQKINEQMAIPEVRAGVQAAEEQNRLELAGRQQGITTTLAEAERSAMLRRIKTQGSRAGFGNVIGQTGREIDASIADLSLTAARSIPGADRRISGSGSGADKAVASVTGIASAPLALIAQLFSRSSSDIKEAASELRKATEATQSGNRAASRPPRQDWINAARRDQAVGAE